MGRVSKQQAQEHREQVVSAASRLFRERGVSSVSVADVMADVGLTHGGFYRQFESKESLLAEATGRAFDGLSTLFTRLDAKHPADHDAARRAFFDYYLSAEHRDSAGTGCPTAALAADMAHEGSASPAFPAYVQGVEGFARWLAADDSADLATLSTLVGALILARATAGSPASDRILAAAHESLTHTPAAFPPTH